MQEQASVFIVLYKFVAHFFFTFNFCDVTHIYFHG